MLKLAAVLLAVTTVALAAVDYRPPSHHDHPGRGHRRHEHRHRGHHEHHNRGRHGGRHVNHGPPYENARFDAMQANVNPEWLEHLIKPLQPLGSTLDWSMDLFGNTPWWKGSNVCETQHESLENVTSSGTSHIDGAPITHHHFFTRSSCDETPTAYRCTTIINLGGMKRTVTVTLQCCHGYTRAKGQAGCPVEVELKPLAETMRGVQAGEMLRGLESTGLTTLLEDGNYTVFAPKDQAFKELLIHPDRTSDENVVVITPALRNVVGNVEEILMSHIVPGIIKSGVFSDELLLKTTSPGVDIRINIYDNPKQIMTANCVPIVNPDQMAENGVVHVLDDLLPTADRTVADIVSQDPQLSTLKTMLGRLGIVQTLRSRGQYTLFAPTNAALEKVKPALLNKLLNGDSCLGTLVRTHLLPNVICSSIIIGKVKTRNVLGNFANLTRDENQKLWLGHAQVVKTDVMASNGVVHLVDNVIIPDDVLDVLEVATKVGATSFVKLVKEAGLTKEIEQNGNVTLFLPSNQAMTRLSQEDLDALRSEPGALAALVNFHVAPGLLRSHSIRHNRRFKTFNGDQKIAVKEFYSSPFGIRRVTTAQCAPISHRDLETCNGVVHLIDKVMIPPKGDILDTLSQMSNMSTTSQYLKLSGLAESLQAEGPFTFIAPSNEAWAALEASVHERLEADPKLMASVLKNHLTSGTICCAGIFNSRWIYKQRERMLDSSTLSFDIRNHGYIAGRSTPISKCDVTATNGVVHGIEAVLPEAIKKYVSEEEEDSAEEIGSRERGTASPWQRHTQNIWREWNQRMPNFEHDILGNMDMHWDAFLARMRNLRHRLGSQNWANLRFHFGSKRK